MVEQAVLKLLQAAPAITALVGDRVYYAERPQGDPLPAVVIERGGHNRLHAIQGHTGTTTGFIRVVSMAKSYLQAADIARDITGVLDGYAGTVNVQDADGDTVPQHIQRLKHDGQTDLPSNHRDGEGRISTHAVLTDIAFNIHQ